MGMRIGGTSISTGALSERIKQAGIAVLAVNYSADPQVEDDSIDITDEIHIQVPSNGCGPVGLARMTTGKDAALYPWPERTDLALLIADIKSALADDWDAQRIKKWQRPAK